MLQSDWMSDRTLSAISACAVSGDRLRNGEVFRFYKVFKELFDAKWLI